MNGSTLNNTSVELRWTGSDPDGDALAYTLELSGGAGANLTRRIAAENVTLELSDRTVYTWRVTVYDGAGNVTSPFQNFTVRVDRPPVINSVPVLEAKPGREYFYQVVATDPDSDALRCFLAEMPGGMGIEPGGRVLWVPSAGQAGKSFRVVLTVSDGELEERQEFTVSVAKAQPQAPAEASGVIAGQWIAAGLVVVLAVEIAAVRILWKERRERR
jgi:hypothetical protein